MKKKEDKDVKEKRLEYVSPEIEVFDEEKLLKAMPVLGQTCYPHPPI